MKKSEKTAIAEKLSDAVFECLVRNGVKKKGDGKDIITALIAKLTTQQSDGGVDAPMAVDPAQGVAAV